MEFEILPKEAGWRPWAGTGEFGGLLMLCKVVGEPPRVGERRAGQELSRLRGMEGDFSFFLLRWVSVAARGLFSSCGEQGLLLVAVHGVLIAVASLVAGSRRTGFSSCGTWAQ